jgi:chemotaxis protein CheX
VAEDKMVLKLDDKVAQHLIRGTIETISTMTGITPKAGQWRVESEAEIHGDISGIISVTQENIDGTLVVSFSRNAILFILEKVFHREFLEFDRSVKEAVAEFTNMIYGVVKARLSQSGYRFQMALPTVVMGTKHVVTPLKVDGTMVVPFTIEGKDFDLLLTILKRS